MEKEVVKTRSRGGDGVLGGVVAEWVPPEMGLVGRGVGGYVGGGCLGQNQYCGHPPSPRGPSPPCFSSYHPMASLPPLRL